MAETALDAIKAREALDALKAPAQLGYKHVDLRIAAVDARVEDRLTAPETRPSAADES